MKGTARVLASPAVAMVRLSSAAMRSVSRTPELPDPVPPPAVDAVAAATAPAATATAAAAAAPQGIPIRSVSGTMSAMAAAWRSLRLVAGAGAGGSGASDLVAAGERAGQAKGGREVRKDGVVWKSVTSGY